MNRIFGRNKGKTEVFNLFLRDKPAVILSALAKNGGKPKYASVLAKEADCTYSHTVRILQEFQKLNLVKFEKKGRLKIISLTKVGEELAKSFQNIFRILDKL